MVYRAKNHKDSELGGRPLQRDRLHIRPRRQGCLHRSERRGRSRTLGEYEPAGRAATEAEEPVEREVRTINTKHQTTMPENCILFLLAWAAFMKWVLSK